MTQDRDPSQDPPQPGDGDHESHGGHDDGANAAQTVIARFGGIRPMATKLGVAVSTVQGWKNRGAIPLSRHDEILDAAAHHGIELDPELLEASRDTAAEHAEAESAEPEPTPSFGPTAETEPEPAAAHPDEFIDPETGQPETEEELQAVRSAAAAAAASAAEIPDGEEAGPATPAPPPPQPRPVGWVPGMLLGAAIVIVVAGGTIVLRDTWLPLVTGQGDAAPSGAAKQLAELQQRVDRVDTVIDRAEGLRGEFTDLQQQVQERVGKLDQQVQDLAGREVVSPSRVEELSQRVESATDEAGELASRLDNATTRLETAVGRIDSLAERVDTLSGRVQTVENQAADTESVQKLSSRVAAVDEQLAGMETLRQRMENRANVEEVARTAAASQVARIMVVTELRDALRFKAPFEAELQAARDVLPADAPAQAQLEKLADRAGEGIPTREQLAARYNDAARDAVGAAASGEDGGLLGGVLRRLNNVISVRPVEPDAGGSGPTGILARAQAQLEAGDLEGAVTALEKLSGKPAEAMAPWLADARARVAANEAVAALGGWLQTNARALQQATSAKQADGQGSGG
ncbi:inner membrane protein [Limimonas halophila]|uniref:Inner membrane protein n=1 Tax=Limimonas halophila TaxID=1082479 RepID=A0A1G7T4P7_9PROT|nr:mitofilin family membrane protein [Limimonas halophila]SDG30266.1 inner membrane protein [Limimonas halophila]